MGKRLLEAGLWRLYRLLKLKTPNVAVVDGTEPLAAHYRYSPQEYVTTVSIEAIRAFGPVSLRMDCAENNPFSQALLLRDDASATRCIQRFYDAVAPESAAELLGVASPDGSSTSSLGRMPPLYYVFPWEREGASELARRRSNDVRSEHKRTHGAKADSGHTHWGPNTEQFCTTELRRLRQVYHSIKENGYSSLIRDALGIRCMLVNRGEVRYLTRKGHHRVAALCALGETDVRVRFNERWPSVVNRDEAKYWPNVRSGLFTEEQALAVFDRLFAGSRFNKDTAELVCG